ncbi:MAG: bis-aminopropyl spermidine synthase family protein [Pseudomonadota bacterium]
MTNSAERRLEDIAKATRLREGAVGVRTVLDAVHRLGPAPLADIARAARLPLPVASAVRRELEKAGLLDRRGGVALTDDGVEFVTGELGILAPESLIPDAGLPDPSQSALQRLQRLLQDAPPVDVTLDQAPCTPETALARAALMDRQGALQGQRILILGDDDSVSLALALHHRAIGAGDLRYPVTVLELDENRAGFIETAAAFSDLPVKVVRHDLRDPLPEDFIGQFDVIQTDPPYTTEGAQLFLRRGAAALAPGPGRLGFLSYAQVNGGEQFALNQAILDEGFAIREVLPQFNSYTGASVLGSVGQMLVIEKANEASSNAAHYGPIYTAEVRPRARAYVCTECGQRYDLGQGGAPDTIEALKAMGCPACGAKKFRRQSVNR